MARIVIESSDDDDEFADLEQRARESRAAPSKLPAKTTTTMSRDVPETKIGRKEVSKRAGDAGVEIVSLAASTDAGAQSRVGKEKTLGKEREREREKAPAVSRPKKRVLNPKNDNPLLRPLGLAGSMARRASPDVGSLDGGGVGGGEGSLRGGVGAKSKEVKVGMKMSVSREMEVGLGLRGTKVCVEEQTGKDARGARRKETRISPPEPKRLEVPKSRSEKKDLHHSMEAEAKESKSAVPRVVKPKSSTPSISQKPTQHTKPPKPKDPDSRKPDPNSSQKPSQKRPSNLSSDSSDYEHDSEHDSDSDSTSSNLSSFIVNDSTFLDDGPSVIEIPVASAVPKSVRRLVQGRRPRRHHEESESESEDLNSDLDLDLKMRRLKLGVEGGDGDSDDFLAAAGTGARGKVWERGLKDFVDEYEHEYENEVDGSPPPALKLPKKVLEKETEKLRRELSKPEKIQTRQTTSRPTTSSSEIGNPFTLRFSPPTAPRTISKPKARKETHFSTPPGTPPLSPSKPRTLVSPSKPRQKVPATPHRPSTDAFWAQDVINDWNDAYSPIKTKPLSPTKPKSASLVPLSPIKAREAKLAKKTFEEAKVKMAEDFLAELDEAITGRKVSELARSTGGVKIIWSNKLNTTAGRANWKRETIRSTIPSTSTTEPAKTTVTHQHHASIELASKVISTRSRLLNVIAHEYCHLANFMISDVKTNPHGKEFKVWARRVTDWGQAKGVCKHGGAFGSGKDVDGEDEVFEVTTKHSYEIEYKFIWECAGCGVLYKRHSRSVDVARHQCGTCKGKLVQIKPVPRANASGNSGTAANALAGGTGTGAGGGAGTGAGAASKGLSEYQLFVKTNMKLVRTANPGSPQKEIMGLVGKKYREMKAERSKHGATPPMDAKGLESVAIIEEIDDGKEGTPDADADEKLSGVVRILDFLDLSGDSP